MAEETPARGLVLPGTFLLAVRNADIDSVRRMLDDGFDRIDYADPATGMTALHIAAALNARQIVQLLIATGKCNIAARDKQGRTAATLAIEVADNPALGRYLYALLAQQNPTAEPVGSKGQNTRRQGNG